MDETQVAHFLLEDIQPTAQAFIADGSSAMIGLLGPLAASLFAIYVLLWGAALAAGQISEPFTDFVKRVVRIAIIVALAMTAGVYQNMVSDTLSKAPMEIAGKMSFGGAPKVDDADSMATLLDGLLAKGMEVAKQPWEKGKELNSMSMVGISAEGLVLEVMAIVLMLICVFAVAVAAGLMFVAYMALAILLAIGPLFILFAIFPATQRWAEAWLGQAVNYGMVFILISLASGLLFDILSRYYDTLVASGFTDAGQVVWGTLKAVALAIGVIGVMLQTNSIASGLAGGAAIQASNIAGRIAGLGLGGVGAAMTAGRMARSSAGHGRALLAGLGGRALPNRRERTSRELAHAAGGALTRARQTSLSKNTLARD